MMCQPEDFYPRSPCGERLHGQRPNWREYLFLSTLSLRRATVNLHTETRKGQNFYPRSPCGERPAFDVLTVSALLISIHALLAESDKRFHAADISPKRDFYPRSPCGERPQTYHQYQKDCRFLSTLSLRRATVLRKVPILGIKYFYPRSPCGERRWTKTILAKIGYFYPRSPCGERPLRQLQSALRRDFYPRSPCGERHHPQHGY